MFQYLLVRSLRKFLQKLMEAEHLPSPVSHSVGHFLSRSAYMMSIADLASTRADMVATERSVKLYYFWSFIRSLVNPIPQGGAVAPLHCGGRNGIFT